MIGNTPGRLRGSAALPQRADRMPFVYVALMAAGVGAAMALDPQYTVAGSLVAAIVVSAALSTAPFNWALAAAGAPMFCRLLTVWGPFPAALNFADVPLVTVALLLSLRSGHPMVPAARRLAAGMAAFAAVGVTSGVLNGSGVWRALAGILLFLEPFGLALAVVLARPTVADRRLALRLLAVLGGIQVPFALVQYARFGIGDEVKGTLLAAGAGAHVFPAVVVVALATLVASRRVGASLGLAGLVVAALLAIAADAKQVLFVMPGAAVAYALAPSGARGRLGKRAATALVAAGTVVVSLAGYRVTSFAIEMMEKGSNGGKAAVARAVLHDLGSDPAAAAVGLGPGETVSRLALLTTPARGEEPDVAPVRALGLRPGKRTAEYQAVADRGPFAGASSFTSPTSSLLGVLGDYGLLGLAAFGFMCAAILGALLRSRSPMASAAVAGWAMLLPLGIVFDWLEQPPLTLVVALVSGLAISGNRDGTDERLPSPGCRLA